MALASCLVFFVVSHLFHLSLAEDVSTFNSRCKFFHCGNLGYISFPFSNRTHPGCGLMIVDDCNEPVQKIQVGNDGPWYNITGISQDDSITIQDQMFQKYLDNRSCESFKNLTIPSSPFISFEIKSKLTLFRCPHNLHKQPTQFNISCHDSVFYYNHPKIDSLSLPPPQCSLIQLPVNKTQNTNDLFKLLTGFFSLRVIVRWECYECHRKGRECLRDSNGNFGCSDAIPGDGKMKLKLGLGLGASGSAICILTILAIRFRIFWLKKTENYWNIEEFLRNYESLAPKRYSYADIKRVTNTFDHKLGQGGYGGVYKGKLPDGRNIAVKVLNESKGNGEDFINEVASISRTSHVNIATLLGFCFEGHRRALIYEFVPNGSLEKFLYDKDSLYNHTLNWKRLYQIAVGIARGLEYLHRGCSTRILHFDIKPHNILLDEDFCPKISDFGLAKICPRRESFVSMIGTRGTVGYIAPELFCRNFGEASHKSDVYSYGMMVFEMTGRKNNDVVVNNSSDVYFPDWVYKRLETDEGLLLQGIENEEDKEYAKKMIIVSLWCIQIIPSNRPTITRVVEMLEGSLDSLQIPPKPLLPSQGIPQHADSSTTRNISNPYGCERIWIYSFIIRRPFGPSPIPKVNWRFLKHRLSLKVVVNFRCHSGILESVVLLI